MTGEEHWSIDGIDPAVRAAAERAARASGLTLAEWLEREVLLRTSPRVAAPEAAREEGEAGDLAHEVREIARRIDALDRRSTISISGIDQAVDGVIRRLARNDEERDREALRQEERLKAAERTVRKAVQHVKAIERQAGPEAIQHKIGPLEQALRTLAKHVEAAERRNNHNVAELKKALHELEENGARGRSAREEALTALSARVSGLADRVDAIDLKRTASLRTIEASVQSLAERLEDLDQDRSRTREGVDARLVELSENLSRARDEALAALADHRTRLDALEAAAKEVRAEAARPKDLAALKTDVTDRLMSELEQALEKTLVELSGRLDAASERHKSSVEELDEKFGELIARAERGLEARTKDLTGRLAEIRQETKDAVAGVSASVDALKTRVTETEKRQSNAIAENDARIERLLEKLVALEQRRLDEGPSFEGHGQPGGTAPKAAFALPADEAPPIRQPLPPTANEPELEEVTIEDEDDFNDDGVLAIEEDDLDTEIADKVSLAEDELAGFVRRPTAGRTDTLAAQPLKNDEPVERSTEDGAPPSAGALGPDDAEAPDSLASEGTRASVDGMDGDHFLAAARRVAQAAQSKGFFRNGSTPQRMHEDEGPETATNRRTQMIAIALVVLAVIALGVVAWLMTGLLFPSREATPIPEAPATQSDSGPATTPGTATPPETTAAVPSAPETTAPPLVAQEPTPPATEERDVVGPPVASAEAGAGEAQGVVLEPLSPEQRYAAALMYFQDRTGVPKNTARAFELLKEAADAGFPPAQYRVAISYENGRYVDADIKAAHRYYEAAARAGNTKAMYNLGVLYASGKGVPEDWNKAADWFRRSAEFGVPDAMYNLAVILSGSRIGTADPEGSYRWYSIAAGRGDADAATQRNEVATRLTVEQRMRIDAEVAKWKPRRPDPHANDEPESLAEGAPSSEVTAIQTRLKELGHYTGPADGLFDARTLEAVRAYAAAEGLPHPDGVTAEILARLTPAPQ